MARIRLRDGEGFAVEGDSLKHPAQLGTGKHRSACAVTLIEYETGSATVRNTEHKTATLTKIERYAKFILGFADVHGKSTYYAKHFADGLAPVVLFLARTATRRETIAEAVAEWAGGEFNLRFQVRSLAVDQACTELRALLLQERPAAPTQAAKASPAATPARSSDAGVLLSWAELDMLRQFQEEALQSIQRVRHTVRARQPLVSEPSYPKQSAEAGRLMQWLCSLKPSKAQ